MKMEELRSYMLTSKGRAFFRRTLLKHYVWFGHETSFNKIESIREIGIDLALPCRMPDYVMAALPDAKGIACLSPIGARYVGGSTTPPRFRLAVMASDLPKRLGFDWSYPQSRDLRNVSEKQITDFGRDGVILYVVDDTGSVASYDRISASVLRVCTYGKHGQFPSTWPSLSNVTDASIFTY